MGEWRARLRHDLQSVSGEYAVTDADAILGEVVSAGPTQLTLRHLDPLTLDQERHLRALLVKRLSGAPLAYVLGHVEFYGLDLLCDERVLIPRPETETVVDVALKALPPPSAGHSPLVLDVGTGSGNIALAIAHERPDIHVIATDVSIDALEVARENARRHRLADRVRFIAARSLSAFPPDVKADLLVSNPPYIPADDPQVQHSVHDFEPHVALYSGSDGTEILAELIAHTPSVLNAGGVLVCEIGFSQAQAIRGIVDTHSVWRDPVFHRSIAGFDRVLELRLA